MEKKLINARLDEIDGKIKLVFEMQPELHIDMNSDDQTQLRVVFYEIIKLLFDFEISFEFVNNSTSKPIFVEIAEEYIKQLGDEIKRIKEQIPQL